MKAIQVHQYGEPDVLQIQELPDPIAGPGQIVLKVHAAGVNPVEVYRRAGKPPYNKGPLPYTPGTDAAGEIESVGEGVENWKKGDRVYTFAFKTKDGAYAEKMLLGAEEAFALPENVSFSQGAALGVPYATAHRALFGKAGAKAGESVFIHGASGGVGVAAIQLAKAAGLSVAGSASDEDFIEEQGAKYTFNHHEDDYLSDALGATCGKGFDIILEMLANENFAHDFEVLAPFGRIVIIGNRGEVTWNPREAMSRDAAIFGMVLFNVAPEELKQIHAELFAGLEKGELNPVIGREFPLSEAPAAHRAVMETGARGKIVLVP